MNGIDLDKRMDEVFRATGLQGKPITVRIGTFNFEILGFGWCVDCQEFHIEVETQKDCYDKRTAPLRDGQGRLRLVKEE